MRLTKAQLALLQKRGATPIRKTAKPETPPPPAKAVDETPESDAAGDESQGVAGLRDAVGAHLALTERIIEQITAERPTPEPVPTTYEFDIQRGKDGRIRAITAKDTAGQKFGHRFEFTRGSDGKVSGITATPIKADK